MEESDKTTALKKAYAEIILNTAKESAARIMVSDRKSARFHHDLSETKGEALRLLVRLKHMIDAKTIEADVLSSNQQRQIDVLEAQLHEAEDIISDLRSEVSWVRDRLEKAKAFVSLEQNLVSNEEVETFSVHKVVLGSLNPESKENGSSLDDVECENEEKAKASEVVVVECLNRDQEVADTCFSVKGRDVECENDDGLSVVDTLMGKNVCESELGGDIRIKKLELSRNGCTQRIHALERKSSSSANEEEQQGTSEKESEESLSSGKADGHEDGTLGDRRCLVLALRASSAEVVTMPSNALGIKKTSMLRKLRGRRKRRFGKPKATSVRSQSQLIKHCQSQSNLPCSNTSMEYSDGQDSMETPMSVESKEVDALKTCKDLREHLQLKRTLYSGDISIVSKGKRSKNMHQTDHLVEACQESNLVTINVEDAGIPERETKIKPLPRLRTRKEDVLVDVLVRCEGEEDNVVPSTKMASNLVSMHSDSGVTAVLSDRISESPRANVNRLLMYTFQRKRKRGSANINDVSDNLPGKHEENKAQDPIESTLSK